MLDDSSTPWMLRLISRIVLRLPGRAAAKMADFAHTEYGSGLDMLAAVAHETRPGLRRSYFRHALDELEHARLFRERAGLLAGPNGTALAILADHARVVERGIKSSDPLVQQLPEVEFLAFVWVHELNGERLFRTYAHVLRDDADVVAMFTRIFQDERFHIAYSRKELDRIASEGRAAEVSTAVRQVRTRAFTQGLFRASHGFGQAMASLWLGLLYVVMVGPASLMARAQGGLAGGLITVGAPDRPVAVRAAEQG